MQLRTETLLGRYLWTPVLRRWKRAGGPVHRYVLVALGVPMEYWAEFDC